MALSNNENSATLDVFARGITWSVGSQNPLPDGFVICVLAYCLLPEAEAMKPSHFPGHSADKRPIPALVCSKGERVAHHARRQYQT